MKWFFTADSHYSHSNILRYCNRPFKDVHEMNKTLTENLNNLVTEKDVVIHAGDFTLQGFEKFKEYLKKLRGKHIFIKGSHDVWAKKFNQYFFLHKELPNLHNPLGDKVHDILELNINGIKIVVCHYAMRTWPRSHYGSLHFYGHSHGKLKPFYNALDVGVDNNNYRPIVLEDAIKKIEEQNKILDKVEEDHDKEISKVWNEAYELGYNDCKTDHIY